MAKISSTWSQVTRLDESILIEMVQYRVVATYSSPPYCSLCNSSTFLLILLFHFSFISLYRTSLRHGRSRTPDLYKTESDIN